MPFPRFIYEEYRISNEATEEMEKFLTAFFLLLAAITTTYGQDGIHAERCADKLDLVFVLDSSESITRSNPGYWSKMLTFVGNVVDYFTISPEETRVGIVLYSAQGVIAFNLTAYDNRLTVQSAIARLPHLRSFTNTFDGLNKMRVLFSDDYGDRDVVPNVAIVLTDGDHSPGLEDPFDAATRAQAEGIFMMTIGMNEATVDETRALSSQPQEEGKNFWMTSFDDLQDIVSQVQKAACDQTGNSCTLDCTSKPLDIGFLVDSSGSIKDKGQGNWNLIIDFVDSIISTFNIGPAQTRVGLVTFSNNANVRLYLNSIYDKTNLTQILRTPTFYSGGKTNMAEGLNVVNTELFTALHGDRSSIDNVLIMLTDGVSSHMDPNISPEERALFMDPLPYATAIKDRGDTKVFVVGVTDDVDANELRLISSTPQIEGRNWWRAPEFSLLDQFFDTLLSETCVKICKPTKRTVSSDCALDLVILVDSSGSIRKANPEDGSYDNWQLLLNFIKTAISKFVIGPRDTRVSIILFSTDATLEFTLNAADSEAEIIALVDQLPYIDGWTNTADALKIAAEQALTLENGDRPEKPNVVIMITDGQSSHKENPNFRDPAQDALKLQEKAYVLVVGITDQVDEAELAAISSPPSIKGISYFTSPDFTEVSTILDFLLASGCSSSADIVATTPAPNLCRDQVDLVMVLDVSGSIGESAFNLAIQFVLSIIDDFDIDGGRIQLGLVLFGDQEYLEFHLNTYSSKADLRDAVLRSFYHRGTTNTEAALRYLTQSMFTSQNGDRDNVPNVAVIFTDGGSNNQQDTLLVCCKNFKMGMSKLDSLQAAYDAKTSGVHLITVALGNWVDQEELKRIASFPHSKNKIDVENYDSLPLIRQVLVDLICNNDNECDSYDCENGGIPVDGIGGCTCICFFPWAGTHCEKGCELSADIVFALDASSSVGKINFQLQIDVVTSIISGLNVGAQTRVGLMTYASEVEILFNLNTFSSKQELLNGLSPFYTGGTTNTADAIRTATEVMFTSQLGDRQGVKNILILLSDGSSNSPDDTLTAGMDARTRRQDTIHIVTIGIGPRADHSELRALANEPAELNYMHVEEWEQLSESLQGLGSDICNPGCSTTQIECQNGGTPTESGNACVCRCPPETRGAKCELACSGLLDLALIIDASGSIRNERFSYIIDFLIDIIDQFHLEGDGGQTRIAAIHFSDSAYLDFDLMKYNTRQDVKNALKSITYLGGRTHTSVAFSMLTSQIFGGAGDRLFARNLALVFTDGSSNVEKEKTIPNALSAKANGVHVTSFGVGDRSMFELHGISNRPYAENIFLVNSFQNLDDIKEKVRMASCDDVDECDSNPCRNGGRCFNDLYSYYCDCPRSYGGTNCERRCNRPMDIALVLDLSGSVDSLINLIINFAYEFVTNLPISSDVTRVAMVTYTDTPEVAFYLDTYTDKREILNAIVAQKKGGRTGTSAAIKMMYEDVYATSRGDRNGVTNYAIVVSDGGSNIQKESTVLEALEAKNRGIEIFGVAVGEDPFIPEMNSIASDPANEFTVRVRSDSDIEDGVGSLLSRVC
ncbi:hypothetical protein CAPTEDRAFT_192434 [Capitella teleta]|uniref:Uncharacterized protein n=1 Tax=Capitella teleta TaxID=283909 RepID=R7VCH3_CAPTE|nr:hypothetical protein CAPTEDRAFT_192434 [Capitella teleta]|eukprot:ELU16324.1 hypothetical protein CAPTEDRAFT_192434 [Capitella teleta]